MNSSSADGPLSGLRVLDLSTILAGPLAAQIPETSAPTSSRSSTHREATDARARPRQGRPTPWWKMISRNKRTLGLYLGDPDGARIFKQLARTADVIVENFRPGTLERWGSATTSSPLTTRV